jgi:quinol monooxygenase YgiN
MQEHGDNGNSGSAAAGRSSVAGDSLSSSRAQAERNNGEGVDSLSNCMLSQASLSAGTETLATNHDARIANLPLTNFIVFDVFLIKRDEFCSGANRIVQQAKQRTSCRKVYLVSSVALPSVSSRTASSVSRQQQEQELSNVVNESGDALPLGEGSSNNSNKAQDDESGTDSNQDKPQALSQDQQQNQLAGKESQEHQQQQDQPPSEEASNNFVLPQETSQKFMSTGTHDTFDNFEAALGAPYNSPFIEWMLESHAVVGFPILTMWHRVNDLFHTKNERGTNNNNHGLANYIAARQLPQHSAHGPCPRSQTKKTTTKRGGACYIMRTHSLRANTHKVVVLQTLCQLAAMSEPSSNKTNIDEQEGDYRPIIPPVATATATNAPIPNEEEEHGARARDGSHKTGKYNKASAQQQDHDSNGCIFYDILVSNDTLDRFHEVVEWTCWDCAESYQQHLEHPMTRTCHQIVGHFCTSEEETAWEHNDDLVILSEFEPASPE